MKIALIGILLTLSLFPSLAWSQVTEVSGEVKTPDHQPASGIPVIVKSPMGSSVVFTDENGRWTLYNAPAGNYSVTTITKDALSPVPAGSDTKEVPFVIDKKSFIENLQNNQNKLTVMEPLIIPQKY
ncbi:Hypothetical protein NGAL_HAMBI2610_50760 [Neorhizobium galegae bv. orientalis]|nr:Hypothetical protein NGAL_HAMBI2610_50760 [Neorhizobium galegae bv. orientalis]